MAGSTVINKDNVWSTFPARSLRERLRNRRVKGKIPGKVKKKKKKVTQNVKTPCPMTVTLSLNR